MEIKKLPAFTLMEVTIAMLLTSIVVGITYTAYRIVSRSYLDYAKKQETLATFLTADKLLKQDFLQAQEILKTGEMGNEEGLQLKMPHGLITYRFNENYLLRDQFALRVDTFKLLVKMPDFSFENLASEEGGRVDRLHFETRLEGMPLLLNYKKLYSAQDLFE